MKSKLLSSKTVQSMLIVYILIGAGLLFVVQAHTAAAATGASADTVTVGLQNDMVNMNIWDPATNSVWKQYQTEFNYEGLQSHDPDFSSYPVLEDPAKGGTNCPAGSLPSGPGYCIDSTGTAVTVYIRNNITFTDGTALNADDVIFSFQVSAPWSVYSTSILNAIWWDAPKYPLWNSTANGGTCAGAKCFSHVGITKSDQFTVTFHLAKSYALFFYDTMEVPIGPAHIWSLHMGTWPQLNLSNPSTTLTDSFDNAISFGYGAAGQVDASMGTGPFKISSWTHNTGATIDIYPSYWGKGQTHVWKGKTYPYYPFAVRHIVTKIYGSLDVVSLALQKGDIDTMVWPVTPGFLSQIRTNPAISVEQVTDSGFFYLSFNLRREPWGNPTYGSKLRTAVSMAINKDYIVNTLMGGFGVKGTVPISIANPLYVNTSASPPGFDPAAGKALLLNAGFRDCNGDGFLETPTCAPIKATILTPPKDYDPIRADAGIMISNNLKSMGLDIDAAPTSFDTIVAKAFSAPVNFDIYILGFSLGDFPETYICAFFCTSQDVNLNTGGSNSAGYSNPVVDNLIASALTDTDTATRVQKLKDVEGILTTDLPWNVLYYRQNLVAYRNDAWVGWANYPNGGGIWNIWSIPYIRHALPPPAQVPGALTIALGMPDQVYARQDVAINVYVSQAGARVTAASVTLNISYGSTYFVQNGVTDATGLASFTWTVPVIQGNALASVTVTKGTVSGTASKIMEVTVAPPAPIVQLSLSSATPVIRPTETATITATLIDATGAPVAGKTVSIDPLLVLGTLDRNNNTTDASGKANFLYTPPATSKYTNQHFAEVIKASVNIPNTIVADTQKASMILFVQNDLTPNWMILSTTPTSANGLVLSPVAQSANFTVTLKDWSGAAVPNIDIDPQYTDTGNVSVVASTAGSNRTNANGQANFTVTETASAIAGSVNTNVGLRFVARNQVFATSDMLELLVSSGPTTTGYAAWVTFDARTMAFSPTGAKNNVTAHVVNQLGAAATGVPVFFQIDYGNLGLPAEFTWSMDYATPQYLGAGLDLNSFASGNLGGSFQNSSGQGPGYGVENFIEDFEVINDVPNLSTGATIDSCAPSTYPAGFDGHYYINATSKTGVQGTYTAEFTAMPHRIDNPIQVRAYIGGTPDLKIDACAFTSAPENFAFRVDSGVVSQRAPVFGLSSLTTSRPIFSSQTLSATITAVFKGVGGLPAPTAEVILTAGAGSAARNVRGAFGGTMHANAAGYLNYTRTVALASLSQPLAFSIIPADFRYSYGGRDQLFHDDFGDYWFAPTFAALLAKIPFDFTRGYLYLPTSTAYLTASLNKVLLAPGEAATVTVNVRSVLTGLPIAGATVWSGGSQNVTNATGVATLPVTGTGQGAVETLVVATTAYGGAARGWFGYIVSAPVLSYSALSVTPATAGVAATITATVTNTVPVPGQVTVWLYVDNKSVAAQVLNMTASGTQTVTFSWVFTAGSHTVMIGDQSTTINVAAATVGTTDQTGTYVLAGGLLVAGLVVGGVAGTLMGRRGRRPPTSTGPKSGTKSEEELPPEL